MFDVRPLDIRHLRDILEMQERIYAALQDKNLFQRSTEEFISYCLGEGGRCFGAYLQNTEELIAYRTTYFPKNRPFNLGKGLLPPDEMHRVAHMDTTAVLPMWRRFGVAGILNTKALDSLRHNDVRHIFATVSPYNPANIKALLKIGLRPVRMVEKFGRKLRLLFYRPYPGEWEVDTDGLESVLPLAEIARVRDMLAQGCVGTALTEAGGTYVLTLRSGMNPFRQ